MTIFILKVIAIITMTIDHIGFVYKDHLTQSISLFGLYDTSLYYLLRLIGRISFPLYAYSTGIGFKHTKDLKKYIIRLFIFALASQLIFILSTFIPNKYNLIYLEKGYVNIIFSFFASGLCVYLYEKYFKMNKIFSMFSIMSVTILGIFLKTEYTYMGILLPFFIYVLDEKEDQLTIIILLLYYYYNSTDGIEVIYLFISGAVLFIIKFYMCNYYLNEYNIKKLKGIIYLAIGIIYFRFEIDNISKLFLASLISTIFIGFYNGKKGISMKYLFYVYYPTHVLLLNVLPYIIKF